MIPAASPAKRFLISTHWGGFFVTPDEARREQPIGGLCSLALARACAAFARSGASKLLESKKVPLSQCLRSSLAPSLVVGISGPLNYPCWATRSCERGLGSASRDDRTKPIESSAFLQKFHWFVTSRSESSLNLPHHGYHSIVAPCAAPADHR